MKKRFAVIVPDQDGQHEFDLLFLVPEGMSTRVAVRKVDAAVRKAKGNDPEGYLFEDLNKILVAQGFETLSYVKSTEDW